MAQSGTRGGRRDAGRRARPLRVGTRNAAFQQWTALLTNRSARNRSREFVVQGVRPISLALQADWPVRAVLAADLPPGRPRSTWAQQVWDTAGGTRAVLAPELLAELGEREEDEAPELVLVLEQPPDDLDRLADAARRAPGPGTLADRLPDPWPPLLTVFDRPVSPGNIGTLARSLDAFGGTGLVVSGHAADPYDPRSVRASTGSLFGMPTVRVGSHRELLDWLGAQRAVGTAYTVVGTDETGTVPLRDADLTGPTVLVVGNETRGMTRAWREACDVVVSIPMVGTASSLNAATAGSLVLHAALEQRLAG